MGALTIWLVGCAPPQPSVTLAPSPIAPSSSPAPSPSVTPSASPRLSAADVTCDTNSSIWTSVDGSGSQVPILITLTCESAVAAATKLVGPNAAIASIEFHFGGYCPPNAFCAVSPPNWGHVIFRMTDPTSDMVVTVRADGAGMVTASNPRPLELVPSPP